MSRYKDKAEEIIGRSCCCNRVIPDYCTDCSYRNAIAQALADEHKRTELELGCKINEAFNSVFNAVHEGYSAKTAEECYKIINKLAKEDAAELYRKREWESEEYEDELEAKIKALESQLKRTVEETARKCAEICHSRIGMHERNSKSVSQTYQLMLNERQLEASCCSEIIHKHFNLPDKEPK